MHKRTYLKPIFASLVKEIIIYTDYNKKRYLSAKTTSLSSLQNNITDISKSNITNISITSMISQIYNIKDISITSLISLKQIKKDISQYHYQLIYIIIQTPKTSSQISHHITIISN